ncbi:EAL domain-containing protein [Rhizobium helianthi]|uniref:EAL domain-containing protein n=1 Tax=Rhizobium helianthi TaxID=1132695 RepID=A0ABW4M5B7_9HYPH
MTRRISYFRLRSGSPIAIACLIGIAFLIVGIAFDLERSAAFRAKIRQSTANTLATTAGLLQKQMRRDLMLADKLIDLLRYKSEFKASDLDQDVSQLLAANRHASAIAFAWNNTLSHLRTRDGRIDFTHNLSIHGRDAEVRSFADRLDNMSADRAPVMAQDRLLDLFFVIQPVMQSDGKPWGSVLLALDRPTFLREGGVHEHHDDHATIAASDGTLLDITIVQKNGAYETLILGDASLKSRAPLLHTVDILPTVQWQIMAAPKGGWNIAPASQFTFRTFLLLAGAGILVPTFVAAILIGERNRNIRKLKAREANLLELSQRFTLAMESSNIGIWEIKGDNVLIWDERAAALHGKEHDPSLNRLEEWFSAIHPDDLASAEAHFFTSICSTQPCVNVYRVTLANGDVRYLRSAGASYRKSDLTSHTTGIVWDVTSDMLMNQTLREAKADSDIKNAELELALDELSNREHELEELSTRLNVALASYNCGIWETSTALQTEIWDERMCQLYGLNDANRKVSHEEWLAMIHPEDRHLAERLATRFPDNMTGAPLTVRVPQPDGSIRYVRSIGKPHVGRDGAVKLVGIAFDVTADMRMTQQLQAAKQEAEAKNVELELARQRIEHNALHDPLTNLANRRKLDMELDELTRESRNRRTQVSILHLDLDRFKQINDTLGHAAGDAMLVYAADVLRRNMKPDDLVARIGGDEFVIVVKNTADADAMAELSTRIINEIRQPLDFEGFSCRCGVSIGIAQASGPNVDGRKMLVDADIALYRAKNQGRNRFEFFTQNLQAEIINHKRTADELLTAIEEQQFVTWYQPQFCANSKELTGVEALVRWRHPHRGILAPDAFLSIAEDLNVTANLDQIVLETVLKDQMRWAAMGLNVPKVSVNVSSRRLKDEALIETLKTLPITPGRISFELVESIFLDESEDSVTRNLEAIKALGIDIEIDDFGTGHTSIVSLLKLRPKRLKIDRQLVMPILTSPQERALVRSIIEIAKSLGVETVAEGVETMNHAEMLRELGCDLLQGYAFARPLPFDNFTSGALDGFLRAS